MGEKKRTEKIKLFETKKVFWVYMICNALTIFTIVGTVISSIVSGDVAKMFEHIALCVVAILFYNLPLLLRMKFKLDIPSFLQITVTVFAIAHFVFGEIFRFYDYSLVFDKTLHTISGVIFAICGFSIINGLNSGKKPMFKLSPIFVAIFSFCFALAIGYIWEIIEFTADSIWHFNMQRWQDSFYTTVIDGKEQLISNYSQGRGLIDTMGDMIVNMAGALVISLLGYIWLKKESKRMEKLLIKTIPIPKQSTIISDTASNESIAKNIEEPESINDSGSFDE